MSLILKGWLNCGLKVLKNVKVPRCSKTRLDYSRDKLRQQFRPGILSLIFAPPTIATNGRAGVLLGRKDLTRLTWVFHDGVRLSSRHPSPRNLWDLTWRRSSQSAVSWAPTQNLRECLQFLLDQQTCNLGRQLESSFLAVALTHLNPPRRLRPCSMWRIHHQEH